MIETFWRDNRAAIFVGLLGAVALGSMLAFIVLFVAGMRHCSQCDMRPYVLRGFGASILFASLFGLAVGLGAAALRALLRPYLGARAVIALLVFLALGLAVLAVPAGYSAVSLVEYRIEKAKEDAALAKLRELCPDRSRHLAIIHDDLPRPLPRDTLVAEIRFDGSDVTPLYQSGAPAKVIRMIQGDPAIRELTVERVQHTDRCDKAFANGTSGLAVFIPKELPRGGHQKVEAIFARRGDGFRLPDGFQIREWQRPYWLAKPRIAAPADARRGHAVTHAENGIATTSIDGGNAIVVRARPPVGDVRASEER